MSSGKAVTPAKVAQRYEINKFKHMLNDPFIDPIDRRTAQLMIDNNMRKLGQLALIQEGMKGFPDGIPAIAMPLMGSDMAQQGGQQMMRKGGIVSFKKGGPAKYQGKDRSQVRFSSDLPDDGIIGYDEFGQPIYTDDEGTMTSYFDPQTGEPVYYGGMMPEMGIEYQRTPQEQEAYFKSFNLDQYLPSGVNDQAGWLGVVGTGLEGMVIGAGMQKYGYPALKSGAKYLSKLPYVKQAVEGIGKGLTKAKYKMFARPNDKLDIFVELIEFVDQSYRFKASIENAGKKIMQNEFTLVNISEEKLKGTMDVQES
jgi:hypothetical protein